MVHTPTRSAPSSSPTPTTQPTLLLGSIPGSTCFRRSVLSLYVAGTTDLVTLKTLGSALWTTPTQCCKACILGLKDCMTSLHSDCSYGENSFVGHDGRLQANNGANVFVNVPSLCPDTVGKANLLTLPCVLHSPLSFVTLRPCTCAQSVPRHHVLLCHAVCVLSAPLLLDQFLDRCWCNYIH